MPDLDLAMSRNISAQLIAYLVGKLPQNDFAQWVHQTTDLRSILSPSDYADLMTVNFENPEARPLLDKILRGYIDWAQYEKEQLSEVLMAIIWQDDAAAALIRAHELYSQGLLFLHTLGAQYGLSLLTASDQKAMVTSRRETLLTAIYPKARDEAKRLLTRLVAGQITFTGTYTSEGFPQYTEQ